MTKLHLVCVGLLGLFIAGCQSNQKTENSTPEATNSVAKLEKEVMETHDSLMTQMNDLMRVKKAVRQKAEATNNGTAKKRGEELVNQLNEAEDKMMDWMNGYNGDTLKGLPEEQAINYLKDQQQKVHQVRSQMQTAIQTGTTYTERSN